MLPRDRRDSNTTAGTLCCRVRNFGIGDRTLPANGLCLPHWGQRGNRFGHVFRFRVLEEGRSGSV